MGKSSKKKDAALDGVLSIERSINFTSRPSGERLLLTYADIYGRWQANDVNEMLLS
jgi:hypothetical protein